MSRDQVLTTLRQHAPELQAKGILHLALFGSTARDEAGPASDVDLMAEYDSSKILRFSDICDLEEKLSSLLGTKVDLSERKRLKRIIKESAEEDAIDAF